MRTSKLTKDEPKATVNYPEDEKGPVTVKITGADEPFTKKLTFEDSGGGDDKPPDDGGGDDPKPPDEQGDISAEVTRDETNPRKVTVKVTKAPNSGGGDGSDGGDGSNGGQGSEGGTQGTGASTADHTTPREGEGDESGSADEQAQSLTIEWGGKTKGDAPTELTKGEPVTVQYDRSVIKAMIRIDYDDPDIEAFTKGLKFTDPPDDGDIVVDAQQDEANPRKITLTLKKVPDSAGSDGGSGNGDGGAGGNQDEGNQA